MINPVRSGGVWSVQATKEIMFKKIQVFFIKWGLIGTKLSRVGLCKHLRILDRFYYSGDNPQQGCHLCEKIYAFNFLKMKWMVIYEK